MSRLLSILLLVLLSFWGQLLFSQDQTASISIDVGNVAGKVNPEIFGNNVLAYQEGNWKYASADYWDRGAGIWDPESTDRYRRWSLWQSKRV